MGFLAPAFLVGLVALAVPVLIHLTHRQRRETVAVPVADVPEAHPVPVGAAPEPPALAAVRAALPRSCSWRWPSRSPFFGAPAEPAGTGGAEARVVLLDRSYSMGYPAAGRGRWRRRAACSARRRGDRTGLVFFGETADVAAPLTDDRAVLEAALGGAELRWAGTGASPLR